MGRQVTLMSSAKSIWAREGLLGFYRGSAAIAAGTMAQRGLVMSSYELVYAAGESRPFLKETLPFCGGLEKRTVLGGMTAGFIRSVLECPFEYVKVRRMTEQSWRVLDLYKGFSTLAPRSTLILTSFFVQVDCIQRNSSIMDDSKLGQFLASGTAALISYWLVWPFEVLRNVTQAGVAGSGNTTVERARFIYGRFGVLGFYRGILAGSQSVFLRNGTSMIVMLAFQRHLTDKGFREETEF
mmetsp:Transcript_27222/g.36376  ORF Transcript_27222/g.36376 Transcript_27222/m.36376 type:complete len:240 (+) Transcript_27222:205-924(+)